MLALVASIHVLSAVLPGEDVDGRNKPDHDDVDSLRFPFTHFPQIPRKFAASLLEHRTEKWRSLFGAIRC